MIFFQTPTPTPIPLSQVGQSVSQLTEQSQQLYSTVLQYGALGILGLFVFFMILGALAVILYIYTQRNRKPTDETTSEPLISLAKSIQTLAESSIAFVSEAAKTREMYTRSIAATHERLSINTSSVEENTEILDGLKIKVGDMFTSGSKPLQMAIKDIKELAELVGTVKIDQEKALVTLQQIVTSIAELQSSLTTTRHEAELKLEEIKGATSEIKPVSIITT